MQGGVVKVATNDRSPRTRRDVVWVRRKEERQGDGERERESVGRGEEGDLGGAYARIASRNATLTG